ncbi:MAG: hypothetical protein CMB38_02370 [Euryarchaeota archaeon]|nr:hypothetical protein [Euryarchaeota archaeon]MBM73099.1 hypothetical protein [Euryarchaeota archaeon]DAC34132.1 MAG TPA: hypothetical protein D7I05_04720 [Candidatus Poseidoniales archaeon]|tara:strand:- start:2480 stop:2881 length:402 start_codon:yes stop_codon:yes gene_type:complete
MEVLVLGRTLVALALGGAFLWIGVQHFVDPVWFEPIVPNVLGAPRFWVLASGVAEVAVGLALIIPATRAYGGFACAVLLVVLYWANLYMWVENVPLDGKTYANFWHVVRLLIQLAAIAASLFVAGELRTEPNG